jgi:peptidoglycan/LPS O-acetylase OafA/YrhL
MSTGEVPDVSTLIDEPGPGLRRGAPTPSFPDSRRRLDVQGIRAIAVLLVIGFHAGLPLAGGFTGVDVFFVVSGFVITGLIMREAASPTGFSLRRFYYRRARRLLPALALLIAVVAVLSLFLQSPAGSQSVTLRTGIAAALFAANLEIYRSTGGYFDAPAEGNPLLHTWSLSVEEQFYAVFPVVLVGLLALQARLRHGRAAAAVSVGLLATLGVASFALAEHLVRGAALPGISLPAQFAFYASPTRAWEFVAGALVALGASALRRFPSWTGSVIAVAGGALLAVAALWVTATSGVPARAALIPVLGTAALIAGGTVHPGPLTRALSTPLLVRVGDLSYSLYLWHWPAIVAARLLWPGAAYAPALAAMGSFVPAWLAFRYVESPIHRRRRLPTWSGLRVGLVAIATVLSILAAQHVVVAAVSKQPDTRAFVHAITTSHYDFGNGCDLGLSLAEPRPTACDLKVAGSDKTVYLLGDSQGGQFSEAVTGAAAAMGWNASIATENGCPYAPLPYGCPTVGPSTDWILGQPPGVVVFATEIDGWIKRPDVLVGPEANPRMGPTERIQLWVAAMRRVTGPLVARGHRVLLVQPTPRFHDWDPRECLGFIAYTDAGRCGTRILRSRAEQYRADAVTAQRLLARDPGIEVVDVFDSFCDRSQCYTNRGSDWYSRDVDHISVPLSQAVVPAFVAKFRSLSAW